MAEWRIGRGWSDRELAERIEAARGLPLNFTDPPEQMTAERGWNRYFSESVIAREPPGPPVPEGRFARGSVAVAAYYFSDPTIVTGHFDPAEPLLGRPMLLELKPLGVLHFLSGVVVAAVRDETGDERSVFGFRYDTLQGHIERGREWFLLTKEHATGEISFRIEAAWLPGEFPNWWSRVGFHTIGIRYQRVWHHRAHGRLHRLAHDPDLHPPTPEDGPLARTGPRVTFQRFGGRKHA